MRSAKINKLFGAFQNIENNQCFKWPKKHTKTRKQKLKWILKTKATCMESSNSKITFNIEGKIGEKRVDIIFSAVLIPPLTAITKLFTA